MLRRRSALVTAGLLLFSAKVQAQQVETTRDVNLRTGPSSKSAVVRVVDSGAVVDSVRARAGWDGVRTASGDTGWIYSQYVKAHTPVAAPTPVPSPAPGATAVLSGGAAPAKKGGSSGTAPIEAGPTGTSSTVGCGDQLWQHVYHPDRLVIKQQCITVTGTIVDATKGKETDAVRHEADGDTHGWLKLDPPFVGMLNIANNGAQQGHLVFELVCHYSVTQADAQPACNGFTDHTVIPPVGSHVEIRGTYVQDKEHQHWHEIHPVSSIVVKP
jgi:hypothetical protein